MKKTICIFILSLVFIYENKAQNLVPNSSFEDFTTCPTSFSQINYANSWYQATSGGTPDYYNSCQSLQNSFGVPQTIWGFQSPRSGNAFAGLIVYGATPAPLREYIQAEFIDSLEAGKEYCVKFYVNLANNTTGAISQIGAYISNNPIYANNSLPLPVIPQIVSPPGFYLVDSIGWIEISANYMAWGGEKFITIGNFKDETDTDTIKFDISSLFSYYYIDDVSVIDCNDTSTSVQENENDYSFSLYPNPSTGSFSIKYDLKQNNDIAVFKLYNIRGKLLNEIVLKNENASFDFSDVLANGIYFYQVSINNKMIKSDKIVIIK